MRRLTAQYRILARDLAAWLGPEEARALFGVGEGLETLRAIFMTLSEAERERLLAEALRWAREHMAEPKLSGRT